MLRRWKKQCCGILTSKSKVSDCAAANVTQRAQGCCTMQVSVRAPSGNCWLTHAARRFGSCQTSLSFVTKKVACKHQSVEVKCSENKPKRAERQGGRRKCNHQELHIAPATMPFKQSSVRRVATAYDKDPPHLCSHHLPHR